jgi:hypothetical protein
MWELNEEKEKLQLIYYHQYNGINNNCKLQIILFFDCPKRRKEKKRYELL